MLIRLHWKYAFFEVFLSLIIAILSVRTYLFSTGFYAYADQYWTPTTFVTIGQHPPGLFSPFIAANSDDIFAYFRSIVTWPYYVLTMVTDNYFILQRVFVLYTFALTAIVGFVAAEILLRILENMNHRQTLGWKREAFKTVVVVIAYSNFQMMYYNVDGGTFSDSLILLFCLICSLLLLSNLQWKKSALISGFLLSITLLLDPSFFPIILLYLFFLCLGAFIFLKRISYLKSFLLTLLVTLPVLAFVSISISFVAVGVSSIYRPFSIRYLLFTGRNLSLTNVLIGTGQLWSTVAYGPPSILGYGNMINSLPTIGDPAQIILPTGEITSLWILAVASITIISLWSVTIKISRKLSVPLIFSLFFIVLLTQVIRIPFIVSIILHLTEIPLIGPQIGEAFSLPERFLMPFTVILIILFSTSAYYLMFRPQVEKETCSNDVEGGRPFLQFTTLKFLLRRHKQTFRFLTVFVILITILCFSYWQSFNGSYYPDAADRAGTVSGNGIPNLAPFDPIQYSSAEMHIFDDLARLNGNASFGIYWPNGPQMSGFTGDVNPSTISYILSNGMLTSLSPFLSSQGVRFIVAQNISPDLQQYFGINSLQTLLSDLNSTPGIQIYISLGGIYVYQVLNFTSPFQNASLILTATQFEDKFIPIYSLFDLIGKPAVIVLNNSHGTEFGFGNATEPVTVLSPQKMMGGYFDDETGLLGPGTSNISFNSEKFTGQYDIPGDHLVILNTSNENWFFYNIGNTWSNMTIRNGTVFLNSSGRPSVNIYYNGVTYNHYGSGITVQDPNINNVVARISYEYRSQGGTNGTAPSVSVAGFNESGSIIYSSYASFPYIGNNSWTKVSYIVKLPIDTYEFTAGITIPGMPASTEVKNFNITWGYLQPDSQSPFGVSVTGNFSLKLPSGVNYLFFTGNGTVNNQHVNSNKLAFIKIDSSMVRVVGALLVLGDIVILPSVIPNTNETALLNNYAYIKYDKLVTSNGMYQPIETIQGSELFIGYLGKPIKVELSFAPFVNIGYLLILFYMSSIVFASTISMRKFFFGNFHRTIEKLFTKR